MELVQALIKLGQALKELGRAPVELVQALIKLGQAVIKLFSEFRFVTRVTSRLITFQLMDQA